MALGIGVDIGSISIKLAVIGKKDDEPVLSLLADKQGFFTPDSLSGISGFSVVLSDYRRIKGRPLDTCEELLSAISDIDSAGEVYLSVTGSGAKLAGRRYNAPVIK